MKVEVVVLGSPSLISLMVSMAVKHNERRKCCFLRARELCEGRGGRPGRPVPNKLHGFCGRKAPRKKKSADRPIIPRTQK